MQLTWADIKESTRKLCFLESDEYDEFDPAIYEAANFALLTLARQFPIIETYDIIHHAADSEGYDTYDLKTLTLNELNIPSFMGFVEDNPIITATDDGHIQTADFTILADRYILLPKKYEGEIKAVYKKYPEKIELLTPDNHALEFNAEIASLMPLIMAWRIFKDDDERKSTMYYNEYIAQKNEIEEKQTVKSPIDIYEGAGINV